MADWYEDCMSYTTTVNTKARELRNKRAYEFLPVTDQDHMLKEKRQVLHSDVMHIDKNKFLISMY